MKIDHSPSRMALLITLEFERLTTSDGDDVFSLCSLAMPLDPSVAQQGVSKTVSGPDYVFPTLLPELGEDD